MTDSKHPADNVIHSSDDLVLGDIPDSKGGEPEEPKDIPADKPEEQAVEELEMEPEFESVTGFFTESAEDLAEGVTAEMEEESGEDFDEAWGDEKRGSAIGKSARQRVGMALGGLVLVGVLGAGFYFYPMDEKEAGRQQVDPPRQETAQPPAIAALEDKLPEVDLRQVRVDDAEATKDPDDAFKGSEQGRAGEEQALIKELPVEAVQEQTVASDMHLPATVAGLAGPETADMELPAPKNDDMMPAAPETAGPRPPTLETAGLQLAAPESLQGKWVVNLHSVNKEQTAERSLAKLRSEGKDVEKVAIMVKGKLWYRVRVVGFARKEEAMAYVENAAVKADFPQAWVGMYAVESMQP